MEAAVYSDLRWGDRGRLWIPLDLASVSLCHCLREPQWMVLFSTKIRIAVHSTQLCNKILLSNMAVPWDYSCPAEQPHLVVRVIDRPVIRCQNSFSFSAFRPSTHDTVFHIHMHHSYTNNWQTKIFYFCLQTHTNAFSFHYSLNNTLQNHLYKIYISLCIIEI